MESKRIQIIHDPKRVNIRGDNMKDFFLSHASEDKDFVRNLFNELTLKGHSCWFDEAEILPGDSLIKKIFNEGIRDSKFVILFLSKAFLSKDWPMAELETAIARQIRERNNRIIPYLLGISHKDLVKKYPFFENVYCGNADAGLKKIIIQLENSIERSDKSEEVISVKTAEEGIVDANKFSWNRIENYLAVNEISRIRDTFNVSYHRAPHDLRVDIIEYSNGTFLGLSNYAFWGPDQATPYKSLHSKRTIHEALNDAIDGFDAFDSADYPNDQVFWVSDNDIIYDGNKTEISMDEAYKRRDENKESYKKVEWTKVNITGGPWWLISKNFTSKEFSVFGPIEDDTKFIKKSISYRENGIDFRIETVPISKASKEYLAEYFEKTFNLKIVPHEQIYK